MPTCRNKSVPTSYDDKIKGVGVEEALTFFAFFYLFFVVLCVKQVCSRAHIEP